MSGSEQMKPRAGTVGGIAGEQLRSIMDRVERLNEEKKALNQDIADIFAEARGNGFCVKTIKTIIKRRATDRADLDEMETMLELYERALGLRPADDADEREAA